MDNSCVMSQVLGSCATRNSASSTCSCLAISFSGSCGIAWPRSLVKTWTDLSIQSSPSYPLWPLCKHWSSKRHTAKWRLEVSAGPCPKVASKAYAKCFIWKWWRRIVNSSVSSAGQIKYTHAWWKLWTSCVKLWETAQWGGTWNTGFGSGRVPCNSTPLRIKKDHTSAQVSQSYSFHECQCTVILEYWLLKSSVYTIPGVLSDIIPLELPLNMRYVPVARNKDQDFRITPYSSIWKVGRVCKLL